MMMVDDVITVHAAGTGTQIWRRINMRNSQRGKKRDQFGSLGKSEISVELQPIGGKRNCRRLHPSRNHATLIGGACLCSTAAVTSASVVYSSRPRGSVISSTASVAKLPINSNLPPFWKGQVADRAPCPSNSKEAFPRTIPFMRGTISRCRQTNRSRKNCSHWMCAGLSTEAQSSFDLKNVSSRFGSGILACASAEANCENRANSARLPSVTFDARSGPKSQKKRKGLLAPNSSPINNNGGEGAKSK